MQTLFSSPRAPVVTILALVLFLAASSATADRSQQRIADVFAPNTLNQYVLDIEAALARAQAARGIIPQAAAAEITGKADTRFATLADIAAENEVVRHRMVALLNVWGQSMEGGAEEYLHYGATTVDIYDSARVLQIRAAIGLLIHDLRGIETVLVELARAHRDTPMVGRTIGQQALPITFGKKVSVWLLANRRNIERLKEVLVRVEHSLIMKGAVGSYLGLGEQAIEVEAAIAADLGLREPYPADWHNVRDVFAEYAGVLALISKTFGAIGNELFLLQMTEIAETREAQPASTVGSSTMPHKNNPRAPEALLQYSRSIPRLAEVIADDMINSFERDNTQRPNQVLGEISMATEDMLDMAHTLLSNLQVYPDNMANNLALTGGLIMAQRITFALAPEIGKKTANELVHELAQEAHVNNMTLREVILEHDEVARYFSEAQLDELLDPSTYLGLAGEQVDRSIAYVEEARSGDPSIIPARLFQNE